jgi:hypothetical protein
VISVDRTLGVGTGTVQRIKADVGCRLRENPRDEVTDGGPCQDFLGLKKISATATILRCVVRPQVSIE